MQVSLEGLPTIANAQDQVNRRTLSPFTWNSLKLPTVNQTVKNSTLQPPRSVNSTRYSRSFFQNPEQESPVKSLATISEAVERRERSNRRLRFHGISMEPYIRNTLKSLGWIEEKTFANCQLIWTAINRTISVFQNVKKGQLYNHIDGSQILTHKDKLTELLSVTGSEFYPSSFQVPIDYQLFCTAYDQMAAKIMACKLATAIRIYFAGRQSCLQGLMKQGINLDLIMTLILPQMSTPQTSVLTKLCYFLELYRKGRGYPSPTPQSPGYGAQPSYKKSAVQSLIRTAVRFIDEPTYALNFDQADVRVMLLLLHYDQLLRRNEPHTYGREAAFWIVKPSASSKGAGISVMGHRTEFYSFNDESVHFRNQKRFSNKIIQRYLHRPLLIKEQGQFQMRKFDVRLWVLVQCINGEFRCFRSEQAYCRFAAEKYDLGNLDKGVHLTNNSVAGGVGSVLMLKDLLSSYLKMPGDCLDSQLDLIVHAVVHAATRHLVYQEGCFELFGFDLLIDDSMKLWLLQINLNPACDYERNVELKAAAEQMVGGLVNILMDGLDEYSWRQVGPSTSNYTTLPGLYMSSKLNKSKMLSLSIVMSQQQLALNNISSIYRKKTLEKGLKLIKRALRRKQILDGFRGAVQKDNLSEKNSQLYKIDYSLQPVLQELIPNRRDSSDSLEAVQGSETIQDRTKEM